MSKDKKEIIVNERVTVEQLFPEYLEYYEVNRAALSFKDIKNVYNSHLSAFMGRFIVEEISFDHIESYKRLRKGAKRLNKKGDISNRTINKELAYFSGILRWCEKNGYIKKRQFRFENLPYQRPLPDILTQEDVLNFIDEAEPFYRAMFLFLYLLGLRINEARMLKWGDLDYERKSVSVKVAKGGKLKILPLPDSIIQALEELNPHQNDDYIFMNKRTQRPIKDIRWMIEKTKKKAGIEKPISIVDPFVKTNSYHI